MSAVKNPTTSAAAEVSASSTDEELAGPVIVNLDEGQTSVKRPLWRRVAGVFWDSVDGDPRDKRYIQKLDGFLFSYICLGYFIKYLDQTNISNAFVSGMKEDLGLYGNERNWLNSYFNIGILIGTVPSQIIQLGFIRPSVWIPLCELTWSILVMIMASAKNVETLYALRFFIGLLEAAAFPGYASLLGGWYGPRELNKRMAIFEQTSGIAAMFSGYLQAGLYKSLAGRNGLAGWQWLFIFDGIISIPIAVWGFFAIPDLPHTTRAFYWRNDMVDGQQDKEYGIRRAERNGRVAPKKLTLRAVGGVFINWRLWAFILPYLMVAEAASGTNYFNLYLKAKGYSVVQTNVLPTAGNAISVVSAFLAGAIVDATGARLSMTVLVQTIVLVSNILLAVWHIPDSARLAGYFLSYAGSAAQPIIISWGHHLNAADPTLRQLLVATGNIFTYSFSTWLPLVLFPTYDAPHYKYGYQTLILFGGLGVIGAFLLKFLHERFG
ncbi:MFS transporter, ACS family, pantothenate transporter [Geosmithia morbida]|uniref:MFS transporter, ACS family, pantothenate transporter n=1 Tax=Geosmithia morbida TaxID=1094350 RepID=A0A9P4Z3M0_9HYPO|nr:MFS transporter, ACS family, pantothenate transporter [Geosmithia morbida]KAF4126628.1 MFS transporter, ACS family, pantothenate transporter [Geosmithia morbida]